MNRILLKKAGAAFIAAAMAINGVVISTTVNAADAVKYEFENGTFTGTVATEDDSSASGGSVAYMKEDGTVSVDVEVSSAGMYTLTMYVQGVGGAKQQNISINGAAQGVLAVPESSDYAPVSMAVKLAAGKNTISVEKSWGWTKFDYLTVAAAELPPITASHTSPANINATAETRALMSYLSEVYGNHIISGQQEIYMYGPHDFEYEFEYLNDLTDHYPAIRGFDFLNSANILFGSEDGTVDRMIDWAKNKNGIVTASWHLSVPKRMSGYKVGNRVEYNDATYRPGETDFVPANVLKEGTVEREFYLKSLENIAGQLLELQDAGVPVIWRPLHEAEGGGGETGGWFWWAKDGSAVYKDIWRLTYDTLVKEYGVNNLIWEWNSYNFSTSTDWYPGDDYVDIIGYDKYNCTDWTTGSAVLKHNDSAISSTFYGIMEKYDSTKMVAMAENDSFSTVENLTTEKAGWLYFCTWYDGGSADINFVSDPVFNTKEDTIAMYQSDYCLTLDEMPEDLYTRYVEPVDPALTTTRPATTAPTTTTRATTEADPNKNYGKVVYEKLNGTFKITLPKASDEFYIVVEMPKNIEYANGGLGVTIPLDGEYYWANIQWEANGSGAVKINVHDNFYNCSLGNDEITDEALIAKIKAELGKATEYEGQIWYAQSGGAEAAKDGISIVDVYLDNSSTTVTTTPSDPTESSAVWGDANIDGNVDVADAVLILQYLGNPDAFKLEPQGAINADSIDNGSGITGMDSLAILAIDAKLFTKSELPMTEAELANYTK